MTTTVISKGDDYEDFRIGRIRPCFASLWSACGQPFTDANDASATIQRIEWASGTVKMKLSPHTGLTGQTVDFIELDGSVSLSLDVADATADAANNTVSWSVSSQPWHPGDKLMLRIRKS